MVRPQTQGYYPQIELGDLKDSQASEGISLDMKNSQRYFESRAINDKDSIHRQKVSLSREMVGLWLRTRSGQRPASI